MDDQQPPLAYEPSIPAAPHISDTLPPVVITCLKNARFLHLATCHADMPHVSLMNYTYLPSTPFRQTPTIIMTTNPASQKTHNLLANPKVSLLAHDWVSHRPPNRHNPREGSPSTARQSGLAQMLMNLNTSALSRISATINGDARMLQVGSEEERWCKEQHLENNTFGEADAGSEDLLGTSPGQPAGDGGRGCYIQGEAVRVVVVTVRDGRIADWKGGVQDWAIEGLSNTLSNDIPMTRLS